MTVYQPGPYLLDFPSVQSGLTHHLTFNCDALGDPAIGTAPSAVNMRTKGGTPVTLQAAADAIWAVIRPILPGTNICSQFVLWKFNGTNLDKTFISGGSLTTPNGAGPSAVIYASQLVLTYRSGAGHIGKISIMEHDIIGSGRYPLGSGSIGETAAVKAYLLGATNVIMARDRSFPVAGLNELLGQNEKIFKRRNRQ